jgi:hypothetical protein
VASGSYSHLKTQKWVFVILKSYQIIKTKIGFKGLQFMDYFASSFCGYLASDQIQHRSKNGCDIALHF